MKTRLIRFLRRELPLYRKTPIVRFARRVSQVTFRFIENENYNMVENGEERVLKLLAQSGQVRTIFDVGANIGDYSSTASAAFPQAEIYAFEPVRQTLDILTRRVTNLPNVKVLNYGLSDRDQTVTFSVQPDNLGSSTQYGAVSRLLNPDAAHVTEQVNLKKAGAAATALGVRQIDLLKIDTEGNDWFVLNGFLDWLEAGRIKVIQFEYGLSCIYTKRLLLDYHELLAPRGYRLGKIYPTYIDFKGYHPADEDFIGPNFLAVHESSSLVEQLK
jgi:FkbM family methyltransferase